MMNGPESNRRVVLAVLGLLECRYKYMKIAFDWVFAKVWQEDT